MRALSDDDAVAVRELLVEGLPQRLLTIVAREPGRSEVQLVSDVARWLPRAVEMGDIRVWVSATLDWFVARGDLDKGVGGRYACVPPYLIGDIELGLPSALLVCGDPRAEPYLQKQLNHLGVQLRHTVIQADEPQVSDGRDADARGAAPTDPIAPLGVERTLHVPAGVRADVLRDLEHLGITYIGAADLEAELPLLATLATPARDLALAPSLPDPWEVYDPMEPGDSRWRADLEWKRGETRLVRWRPGNDWRAQREARVFFHAGGGRVAEVGQETASLWQLWSDMQVGRQRAVWRDNIHLWVPGMLPPATLQWLRVLAGGRKAARFRRGWLVVDLNESAAARASAVLARTLGLLYRTGQPLIVSLPSRSFR